jgi:hypothetical protein
MKKLTRNMSDERSAAFWTSVERTAEAIKNAPAWMKAGVDVNPRHFETCEPESHSASQDAASSAPGTASSVAGARQL